MSTATTARAAPGNLPAEVTSFVGRRHEVSGVRRLLAGSRLVTLTGTGGVGKTRLAQRVGLEMRRAFPDGVWLVELAELRDPALLAVTVAEVLGVREESVSADAPRLATFLVDKHLLLILDNCEQIVGACADLAETLLRCCPELRILTTSRQALRIDGEATQTVLPLSVPDPEQTRSPADLARYESATMLVERVTAVLPSFTVTEQNCVTVARLCQALEGVPLAIELTAARLRVLSLEQTLERLTDRYRLLTSGTRNAPARQQTLRALIDWSWDLCSEAERTLWARISVFSGGLELDTAEAVCSGGELPPDAILDLIASLVDKSVLMRSGDGSRVRYRLLEVIREYGVSRLREAGEQEQMRRRHCEWFAQLAARGVAGWVSPEQPALMLRMRHEQANIRVALEFAVAEGPPELALQFAADLETHWFVRGFLSEGRHWLTRALAIPAPVHRSRIKALRVAAWIAGVQADRPGAEALLAEARQLNEVFPSWVEHAYIAAVQGNIAMFHGEHATAFTLFEESLDRFRATGSLSGELWILAVRGLTRGLAYEPVQGFADLVAARDLAAGHGEVWWRSFASWGLSVLRWRAGDNAGATTAAKQGLQVGRVVQDEQFGVSLALETLAWIAATQRRDQRAAQLLGAADRLWRTMRASMAVFEVMNEFHDACVRELRARMSDKAFETAFRRGAELPRPEIVQLALEQQPRTPTPPAPANRAAVAGLTRREQEVALLVAEGLSNREIAARLVVAQRTAEGHVENILSKLGFTSRAQVAGWVAAQTSRD